MSELEQKCKGTGISDRDLTVLIALLTLRKNILKHKTMVEKTRMNERREK